MGYSVDNVVHHLSPQSIFQRLPCPAENIDSFRPRIERYCVLCHLAWTLAYRIKHNGYLRKTFSYNPEPLDDVKQAINYIIVYQQTIDAAKTPHKLAGKKSDRLRPGLSADLCVANY